MKNKPAPLLNPGIIPSANHAGGLRYHGMSPVVSQLYHDGLMEATSVEQTSVFEAAEHRARRSFRKQQASRPAR